jgi:hypothetical protein
MWQMLDLRSVAMAELSKCAAPTTKIHLGRKYDYPEWVRDGLLVLCLRHEPLDVGDVEGLSVKEILGVVKAREKIRLEVTSNPYYGHVRVPSYDPMNYYQGE